jgi:heme A synthase
MPRARTLAGALLLAPLALATVGAAVESVTCDWECGDTGRGYFMLFLLCTPPAAVGAWLIVSSGTLPPLVAKALTVAVACCLLLLLIALVFALGQAVHELTREGQDHVLGPEDGSAEDRADARRAGVAWLAVSAVLAAMTAVAAAALRAAWRRPRRSPPPLRE